MKKYIFILVLVFSSLPVYPQWINGMSVYPPSPTTIDNILVIVEGRFPSGGCSDWYILSYTQNGFELTYNVVNCVGPLAYICSNNDTINVGNALPAGSYNVIVNLNAGSGDKPCPPFSQWASDTIYFDVTPFSGMANENSDLGIKIYPDPATEFLIIEQAEFKEETSISIYNLQGQLLLMQTMFQSKEKIDISSFASGVLIIKLSNNSGVSAVKFVFTKP
ncbi:MAG TPA: T9SS type A sorting domain-containing protein [Bacteroidales bacterium]|nr:T9SS type A sorting domain-containing protein [Bacteroidales bacterium]